MHPNFGHDGPPLRSPLAGHCSIVALMVRGMFGGVIVTGLVDETRHYWNRLPDGREVDLTSCQFGGDGVTPLKRGRKVRDGDFACQELVAAIFAATVRNNLEGAK